MATFNQILQTISQSVNNFSSQVPALQQDLLDSILDELKRLDLDSANNLKSTVGNIKILSSIKSKLTKLVMNDDYLDQVKEFISAFNTVSALQNEYWQSVEQTFKPKPLLREIRTQAIEDTVSNLTENGIGTNISAQISAVLRQNITSGGSYRALQKQLTELLTDTPASDGLLTKYTRQVTTDAINQYNAQYTQAVASGLGYEWFAYQGSDLTTTRPFCDAMTDFRYFHITEIPRLLAATDLYYTNKSTGARELVPIYAKTGLPQGMIAGTNSDNFFINRGGYNCGHQIRPVSESLVPEDIQIRVKGTPNYTRYQKLNS
jgi:hypothetical protein